MINKFYDLLTEAGVSVQRADVVFLNETQQLQVTDTVLTEMFKFVSEKYNSIDFSEIEKSAGDFRIFKYNKLIQDNIKILSDIYRAHNSKIYTKYIESMQNIISFLNGRAEELSYLYKKERAIVQVLYVSMVSSLIYAISALISVTIRFVSLDENSEVEVVVEEISKTSNYLYLRNVEKLSASIQNGDMGKLINEMMKVEKGALTPKDGAVKAIGESVVITLTPVAIGFLAVPVIAILLLKIVPLIREIIYSVYHCRVKISEALDLQVNLLRTNIDSLDARKANKKVIVRQKKIANTLELVKNKIAVKFDQAEPMTKIAIREENKKLDIKEDTNHGVLL